jgi:energy-converting hydrogenase A subunit M
MEYQRHVDIYNFNYTDWLKSKNEESLGLALYYDIHHLNNLKLHTWIEIEKEHSNVTDKKEYKKLQPNKLIAEIKQKEVLLEAVDKIAWDLETTESSKLPKSFLQKKEVTEAFNRGWEKTLHSTLRKIEGKMIGGVYNSEEKDKHEIYALFLWNASVLTAEYK